MDDRFYVATSWMPLFAVAATFRTVGEPGTVRYRDERGKHVSCRVAPWLTLRR
jgi:hypothetical protein